MIEKNVRVIADAGALTVYSSLGGIAVGELLGEIEQVRGAVLGVPVTSFLKAFESAKPDERERLINLIIDPDREAQLLSLLDTDMLEIAELLDEHDEETAHCIVETRKRQTLLATYDADRVRLTLDEDLILELVEP